ncbi:phosphate starvation-inducible protein PhoH [Bacillus norwichensis]|uniref:Phosphate starvation-inducible protein PhoH n=1 Tax=Bacillus norwichensis TaxID=2762217 RepID=A0ABR8VP30_9BACI|nr:phosphate starvation-inducible protein PhoH [Bacillus norwichensis]MBD8006472.1 phosphate starvation-inducible protein PhoH [Bacillus norwichensis]
MKTVLFIQSGAVFGEHRLTREELQHTVSEIDVYDLKDIDLSPYKSVAIDSFVDQRYLMEHRNIIEQFLNQRKIVIFSGNLYLSWLPGVSNFVARKVQTHRDYEVENKLQHPIFSGVEPDHMTYKRGVSGFFARGHHPVPDGAEVILTLRGDIPITYIDRVSTKGTILVHAGNDLFKYNDPDCTTGRIKPQLMEWVEREYVSLQEGHK